MGADSFPREYTMRQLRRLDPGPGLVVVTDRESKEHHKIGDHYITKAASGFRLAIVREPGALSTPGYIGKPGFLRWCRSERGEGLRCEGRGLWVFDGGTSHTMVFDRDEPVFEVTTEGAP